MKFIVSLFLVVFTVTAFAAPIPGFFKSTNLTEKQIDDAIAQWTAEKDEGNLSVARGYKALYGKDIAALTYSQVKQIIAETVPSTVSEKGKSFKVYKTLRFKVFYDPAFGKFTKALLEDPNFAIIAPYEYLQLIKKTKNYELFLDFINSPSFEEPVKSLHFARPVVNLFIEWRFKYTPEVQLKTLQRLKAFVYPNIGINDNWKALAVKLELAIKSLQ